MPRSDRFEQNSLSRVSVGHGSLGRASELSSGSVATRHWVNSVSDIYGPDEIEELLEDLNRLEFAALEADDFRDYDIDGSRVGSLRGGRSENVGRVRPRDRLASPEIEDEGSTRVHNQGSRRVPSPSESVNSWDSHVHYRRNEDEEDDEQQRTPSIYPSRLTHSIICFCDTSTFKTPRNFLRVLLVVTSVACLSTVLTAGTAKSGIFALPHFPRLRLIIFVSIFTILFTLFILFLNISHLHALLPVEYGKMQTVVYLILTVLYVVSSSLLFHLQSEIRSGGFPSSPLPHWTKNHLIIAACLGFVCGVETFLCCFTPPLDDRLRDSSTTTHFSLQETTPRGVFESSHYPHHSSNRAPPPNASSEGFRSVINPQSMQHNAFASSSSPSKSDVFLRRHQHDDETKFSMKASSSQQRPHILINNSAAAAAALTTTTTSTHTSAVKSGAIPKTTSRRGNHLDEIVALPMDDFPTSSSPPQPSLSPPPQTHHPLK
ncbi:unnamed protein product [Lepeophtheirus salmonis]|uniref:(salmon louse) hypothetical protein n=1 Tax=Lepeophtheirus salmonis TaxID=72036 RepID=A0A7R8D1P4_LEPSM|nr:unnamed protein product [Lepeophtheirus salmonis]CAF2997755.1 unnamed protein product [Lepeophtheirus salmonis]